MVDQAPGCDGVFAMRRTDSGQAVVETAIVMPLFVFILLGMLQLSLMHQARLMTKYAAFKASRAGSIGNAKKSRMEQAALSVLLPFVSRQTEAGGVLAVYKSDTGATFKANYTLAYQNQQQGQKVPAVEVMVCGPTKTILKTGADEYSFDDPTTSSGSDWEPFDRTRLAIQVTFNYRMIIPFANMMLWHLTFGDDDAQTLWLTRTGTKQLKVPAQIKADLQTKGLKTLASAGVYVLPIRASWSMRMQSDLFPNAPGYEIPQTSECIIPFAKLNGSGGVSGGGTVGDEDDPGDDG